MMTRNPFRAAASAAAMPPNPPPMTTRSAESSFVRPDFCAAQPLKNTGADKIIGTASAAFFRNVRRANLFSMCFIQVLQKNFFRVRKLTTSATSKVIIAPLQKPRHGVVANCVSSVAPPVSARTGVMKLLMPA